MTRPENNQPPDDYTQYSSTSEEIRQAVRENSVRRGQFLLKHLAALDVAGIVQQVEQLGLAYDMEHWREQAAEVGITSLALDILDAKTPSVPYPYYFCLPDELMRNPRLLLYYRNVAMVSNKVMNNIGLDTTQYEAGLPLDDTSAQAIAHHLNTIISALVEQTHLHNQQRHIEMVYTNIGASLDGGWRNEVGRLAYVAVLSPLILYLHRLQKVDTITYRLKGRITLDVDSENETGKLYVTALQGRDEQVVMDLLAQLEEERIVYRQIDLTNGNRVLLNRQLYWHHSETAERFRIGPDLITETAQASYPWAAELKGGADPAGSDEHWKTATQAFNRIIKASNQTKQPVPKLVFMATIIVDRVAQEAALWLHQGKLAQVYNLTKINNDPALQQQFWQHMTTFFELT